MTTRIDDEALARLLSQWRAEAGMSLVDVVLELRDRLVDSSISYETVRRLEHARFTREPDMRLLLALLDVYEHRAKDLPPGYTQKIKGLSGLLERALSWMGQQARRWREMLRNSVSRQFTLC